MKSIPRPVLVAVAIALAGSAFAGPVNVNTADAETLAAELTGIGMERAEAIVEYRRQHGPFRTVSDILKVSGVGQRTLEQNRGNIRLGDETPSNQK